MSHSGAARWPRRLVVATAAVAAYALVQAQQPDGGPYTGRGEGGGARVAPGVNLMQNPYRMVESWPTLNPGMSWGAAINFLPDNEGGTWALLRTEPPVVHFDETGAITQSFGDGVLVQAHGMCRDSDGNFWVGDSGPFRERPETAGRGFQLFKFSSDGELLLSLGQAGVSRAGRGTFIGPTACLALPDGDILVAHGRWPRPSTAQQDGDRLVRITRDGEFVRDYGTLGRGPGEFMGPHAMALDSQGRIFVADRSNNRIQIFDKDLTYLDSWKHFGRPSGITILSDDTIIVADSESGLAIPGPSGSFEGAERAFRNVGWKQGIRIGSAEGGTFTQFIDGTNPEGMAGDEHGNIFAGLTGGCQISRSGGCIQKWVKR